MLPTILSATLLLLTSSFVSASPQPFYDDGCLVASFYCKSDIEKGIEEGQVGATFPKEMTDEQIADPSLVYWCYRHGDGDKNRKLDNEIVVLGKCKNGGACRSIANGDDYIDFGDDFACGSESHVRLLPLGDGVGDFGLGLNF